MANTELFFLLTVMKLYIRYNNQNKNLVSLKSPELGSRIDLTKASIFMISIHKLWKPHRNVHKMILDGRLRSTSSMKVTYL